jgi:hypothetical protein
MFDKLVTAALLTISLILLTGFNRPSAIQNNQNLLPINKASTQAAQAVKHF